MQGIFFPRIIHYTFCHIYGGLGVGNFGLWSSNWFLALGLSVDGVWGLCVGPSDFLGSGSSYINIEEQTWEKTLW